MYKVTLLYHSCVLVELDSCSLLFDPYSDDIVTNQTHPLYIFNSHNHHDHYHESVASIKHPNKTYIFSSDIQSLEDHYSVSPHNTYEIDNLIIKTLFSTDQGVGFIVDIDQMTFFHPGDLNWWHWKDEDERFNIWQKEHFQNAIQSIKEEIDLACIVIDGRLEEYRYLALDYMCEHLTIKHILPIHYFEDYSLSSQLSLDRKDPRICIPLHNQHEFKLKK